jgi:phosphodiesterase/alkaline phosphatase D-like protein
MSNLILGPIIGGLSPSSVNLWGRADGEGVLNAWLGHQPDLSDASIAARSLPLAPENGYCGVIPLRDLTPNTQYHFLLSLDDLPPNPSQDPYPQFTTFPEIGQPASFTFVFGSCFLPPDATSGQIFNRIEEHCQQEDLRFWLLIGDQIYADDAEHNGIGKIAVTQDDFRSVYKYAWSRPIMQKLLANFPAFMIMDDHDVEDDWCWITTDRLTATIPWWNRLKRRLKGVPLEQRQIPRQRVLDALQVYWEHQAMHAPPLINSPSIDNAGRYDLSSPQTGGLDYSFEYGAAAFYVVDTRTQRVKNSRQRIMLSETQWKSLEDWLVKGKDAYPVKFIISSGAILYRFFLDFPADRWSGFARERDRLLGLLSKHDIERVYFLTGDLHAAHAQRADYTGPGGKKHQIWEFCSTPFEQKPNRTSGTLYNPFRFWQLENLKLEFRVAANNYGVIRVDFSSNGDPQVTFEVYGEDGQLLGKAGDETAR